jgi:hypothetical protein
MSKYGNRKIEIDGVMFDSIKEGRRYQELKLLQNAGLIFNLELQPFFELQPAFCTSDGKKERAITYKADFMYWDVEQRRYIVEDVKGVRTEVYKIKRKMMLHKYPQFKFQET